MPHIRHSQRREYRSEYAQRGSVDLVILQGASLKLPPVHNTMNIKLCLELGSHT